MLHESILQLYRKLRLDSYRQVFCTVKERDGSLSATEAFSADVIHLLGQPTLTQFAQYLGISQPNATYKVNALASKGYLDKIVPDADRREIRLTISDKFHKYYDENHDTLKDAVDTLEKEFSKEELNTTRRVLDALLQCLQNEDG